LPPISTSSGFTPNVFTPARFGVLDLLASQAAMEKSRIVLRKRLINVFFKDLDWS
jgi:hypothetical protein